MRSELASLLEGVTTVAAVAIIPVSLWAVFAWGFGASLAVFLAGYFFLVPGLALLTGAVSGESVRDYWTGESGETDEPRDSTERSQPESAGTETDPLERLRERYARGEIDDVEFERRVEDVLESDGEDRNGEVREREPVPERE